MNKKYSLESRFIQRLKYTNDLFGYISLDAIINSQLGAKIKFKPLKLKRVYNIEKIEKQPSEIPESFKRNHQIKTNPNKNSN
ncbi:hypothetical protein [Photobacterium leiognathi]|uniref:hypothetical protein n=1 Tax=Photobacterium leiognathi TaxID=553611 RepID=UPI0027343CFE|nr:hypothetical protein [Photobacterium leiognathi]